MGWLCAGVLTLPGVVAIVGRPNVGKSTLFNRLAGRRIAIVQDQPAVTRDRIYAEVEWQGRAFQLIDTGGLLPDARQGLGASVRRQVELAVADADVIVLVADARQGATPVDQEIAARLRSSGKPVLLVANKVDSGEQVAGAHEFYRLGLQDVLPVSAEHGLGTGDLLDAVTARLPGEPAPARHPGRVRVVVVGRPNVGKSSLVNRVLRDERVVVSAEPGTTRDAVDVPWDSEEGRFVFVDTAGLRRRARIAGDLEYYAVVRARRALVRGDVALALLDAGDLVTEQDRRVVGLVCEAGRALLILVNKWDLTHGAGPEAAQQAREAIRQALPNASFAPVLLVSARTGRGLRRLPEAVRRVHQAYRHHAPTPTLNRVLQDAYDRHHPAAVRGRRLRLRYATQVRSGPPTYLLFVNDPALVPRSYRRYLERRLRERLPLEGTPLRLLFRRA